MTVNIFCLSRAIKKTCNNGENKAILFWKKHLFQWILQTPAKLVPTVHTLYKTLGCHNEPSQFIGAE